MCCFITSGSAETLSRLKHKQAPFSVTRESNRLVLDFPSQRATPSHESHRDLIAALGVKPEFVFRDCDYLAVFENAEQIKRLCPDLPAIAALKAAVIVTAPGSDCDFVSRYFAPNFGIPEDPVTGSIHCTLIPYWSERLKKRASYPYAAASCFARTVAIELPSGALP